MKNAPIKKIELDQNGHLHVYPDVAVSGNFEFIYRDASGVDWDQASQALIAREPKRWQPETLFGQIICAVKNEYGVGLKIDKTTTWLNVSENLKLALTATELECLKLGH